MRCQYSGTVPGSVKTHAMYEPRSNAISTWKTALQNHATSVDCGHTTGQSTYGPYERPTIAQTRKNIGEQRQRKPVHGAHLHGSGRAGCASTGSHDGRWSRGNSILSSMNISGCGGGDGGDDEAPVTNLELDGVVASTSK